MLTVIRRLGEALFTMVGAAFLMFLLVTIGTDELARQIASGGENRPVSALEIAQVTAALGLDDPLLIRFSRWLAAAARGDLGWSYLMQRPVTEVILSRFPATLALAALSLILTAIVSLTLGCAAAYRPNGTADLLIRFLTFAGLAIPSFWLGLILLYMFGFTLRLLPILSGPGESASIILPAVTLAAAMSSRYIRQVRAAVLEELSKDYVTGARARGMTERSILFRDVLPNALASLLTLFALSAGSLLGGAAVVEAVFGWPGLGQLSLAAVDFRDIQLLQGLAVWAAGWQTLLRSLADLALLAIDPRLTRKEPLRP